MNINDRTWYDNHRQQILSGKDKLDTEEVQQASFGELKVKKFLDESCFSGLEGKEGFYAVYRGFFEVVKD